VIGSANIDFTVKAERLPRPGETVSGGELFIAYGGKGANQAVAAKRLGAEVRFIACLGRDEHGRRIASHLAEIGLPADRLIRIDEAATGVALLVVDKDGQNQIAVAPGANGYLTVNRIRDGEADIAWAEVLLLQLEVPIETVHWAWEQARRHGLPAILDPASFRPLPTEIFSLPDFITPNRGEAEALTGLRVRGISSARAAAERLQENGFRGVVITLGAKGAFCLNQDKRGRHFKAFSVEVLDTTAAGDAFNGALAVGLASGGTMEEAIPFASAAAALACTRRGAQESLPDRVHVDEFLESRRKKDV
jgi:ribokinase